MFCVKSHFSHWNLRFGVKYFWFLNEFGISLQETRTIRDSSLQCFEINIFILFSLRTKKNWLSESRSDREKERVECKYVRRRQQLCNDNAMLMLWRVDLTWSAKTVHLFKHSENEWTMFTFSWNRMKSHTQTHTHAHPFLLCHLFVSIRNVECAMDFFKDED